MHNRLDAVKQIRANNSPDDFAKTLLMPIHNDGYSVLIFAISHGHTAIIQYFLDALTTAHIDIAAAVMQPDKMGRTSLMHAVYHCHREIVSLLLQSFSTLHANTQASHLDYVTTT